ncbi:MAG: hypothetical protein ACRDQ4_13950 [Pseudonocardiaceae bacterium]
MTTERDPVVPDQGGHPTHHRRKAIPAACALEGGPVEQVNLMVSNRAGTIVLNPQVAGSCVISLDEEGAATLGDLLSVWLG